MSDQEIEDILIQYLENDELYQEKKQKGIEFAKEYTQEKYAERLYEVLQKN